MEKEPSNVEQIVKERYSSLALTMKSGESCCTSSCCSEETQVVQKETSSCCNTSCCEDEQSTGNDNLQHRNSDSLGCDLRLVEKADPKQGETVVDLGSGPGHDSRKIAEFVGDEGRVIGIDFGDEMLSLARSKSSSYSNLEFQKGDIKNTGLGDNVADLVISNCVINLVPDKVAVFREAYRILKSGGRFVFSDMITISDVSNLQEDDYCACIGGATSIEEYKQFMSKAGFSEISAEVEFEDNYEGSIDTFDYQSVLFTGYKE